MIQLVYISTARASVIDDALLSSILEASRRNNGALGLTGLLLVGGRRFLQALEGPLRDVEATYARIKADPRHFAFVELSNKPIERAEFGDWAMAHGGPGDGDGILRDAADRLTRTLPDRDIRALFTGFAEIHGRPAARRAA